MYNARVFVSRVVVLGLLLAATQAGAVVRLPQIFGDNMVLQRGQCNPIWGWADAGETVTVRFDGETVETVADASGAWRVTLPPHAAGGPFCFQAAGAENTVRFENVLVGEVWVCSGQSNMGWPVSHSDNADAEIVASHWPSIRLFQVEMTVATEPQQDTQGSWEPCGPSTVPNFSAVAYYFGRALHQELDVPIGLIQTAWGGTPVESWIPEPALRAEPRADDIFTRWDKAVEEYPQAKAAYDRKLAEWQVAQQEAREMGARNPQPRPWPPMGPGHPWTPCSLYNAMIHPIVPYGIQGAIWYQGESNANRAEQYQTLFPLMINEWRDAWGEGDFPFYFVQLANFTPRLDEPGDSDWAELREAQTMTLDLPNTGMAVTIDIGEADDIHPRNKQDVGKRLAWNALAKTYDKNVPYSGPVLQCMRTHQDGKVVLRFRHDDGGLVAKGGTLEGFALAGEDQVFHWAEARIRDGAVVLFSEAVENPVAVRYAWAHNPRCTLYNGAGLPASPFRTDDWPGVTAGKN